MGEVVQLFKKLTPEVAREKIIDNLRNMHHCKYVNRMCAVNGLDDFTVSNTELKKLVDEGIIEMKEYTISDVCKNPGNVVLYRYNILWSK